MSFVIHPVRLRTSLLAIAALLLAAAAWRDAATAYWLSAEPARAPAVLQADARLALAATDAAALTRRDQDKRFWRPVPDKARSVLRAAPLEAMAVRQLGFAEDALGRPGLAHYLALAERISRRDVQTQIGLLRIAAETNQYRPSFMHLDTILTTEPDAGTQFFAAMATLLGDPEARRMLASYTQRLWFGPFAEAAVQETQNPADLAALLIESRAVLPPMQASVLPHLLARLVDAGEYAKAKDLALHVGKAHMASLDDFTMTKAAADPRFAPLTWRIAQTDAVQTGMTGDGVLEVELRPNVSAQVADRITSLAPGAYAITHAIGRENDGGELLVTWELFCQEGDEMKLIWQQALPLPTPKAHENFRSRFEVPGNCPIQQWRLIAMADETQSDTTFRIAALRIGSLSGASSRH